MERTFPCPTCGEWGTRFAGYGIYARCPSCAPDILDGSDRMRFIGALSVVVGYVASAILWFFLWRPVRHAPAVVPGVVAYGAIFYFLFG